jgi:hypothetical protein
LIIEKPHTRLCPICQKELAYREVSEKNRSIKRNTPCRACSNSSRKGHNSHEEISISWFNSKARRAKQRGYDFTITVEQIWDIYIAQDKVCALSGVPIAFNDNASIDRIDSKIAYIPENVQIVHKDVNYMKYTYSQDYFIKMCNLVALKHNVDIDEEVC